MSAQAHEPLDTFDPPIARAVATLLRARGVPSRTTAAGDGEDLVLVPAGRRQEALTLVAGNMEEIATLAAAQTARDRTGTGARGTPAAPRETWDPDDVHSGPPLVLERFRNARWLVVVVLAPLLVITLAQPGFPLWLGVVVLVGGAALIVAWRHRQDQRR